MAILPIFEASDPRLRVIATPVKTIDNRRRSLIAGVIEPMDDTPGIGPAV